MRDMIEKRDKIREKRGRDYDKERDVNGDEWVDWRDKGGD